MQMTRQWHKKDNSNVQLLHINPYRAEELRRGNGLRSVEVGIWYGKYSLEFQRDPDSNQSAIRLYLSLKGDKNYDKVDNYIESLKKHGKPVSDICADCLKNPPSRTDVLHKTVSTHWPDYVDCQKRLVKEQVFLREIFSKFMHNKRLLPKDIHVLDAAAGIGCETIFLSTEGYKVTSNEIVDDLSQIAFERMNPEQKMKIHTTTCNWRQMSDHFGNKKFDVVLVLGNSLCLVHNEGDRKLCLQQFYKILKPGGILLIDQRNFKKINTNLPQAYDPDYFYKKDVYSGEYMYCGNQVRGWPSKFNKNENIITFVYGTDKDHIYGDLEMYTFRDDELADLLRLTEFVNIETYSDFKLGSDGNADFFTYVAQRPIQT